MSLIGAINLTSMLTGELLNANNRRRLKRAMRDQGFDQEQIARSMVAIDWQGFSERQKRKVAKRCGVDVEKLDFVYTMLMLRLVQNPIIPELIYGKKRANEIRQVIEQYGDVLKEAEQIIVGSW